MTCRPTMDQNEDGSWLVECDCGGYVEEFRNEAAAMNGVSEHLEAKR